MNVLEHFPHQGIDGTWHAVYRTPGCDSLVSVGASNSKAGAVVMARDANTEAARSVRQFDNE